MVAEVPREILTESDSNLPEYLVSLKIEKLDEGVYLATSDTLQGLVAQGRTIAETMDIAQDVARKLMNRTQARRPFAC
jgi:predicted RNase H-like HicB family nuclease